MNDKQLHRLLDSVTDDDEIVAVLLSKSGWVKAEIIRIRVYFPVDEHGPALWAIDLLDPPPKETHHTLYITADAIIGVSIRRSHYAVIEE